MFRTRKLAAVSIAALLLLTGCGQTIEGTPRAAGIEAGSDQFRSLLQECNAVSDDQIAQVVGGSQIARGFFGAICRWDVAGPTGAVKVTFNWFESGSLDAERAANEGLGYQVEDSTVSSRRAIVIRQPDDPSSCGVAAGSPDVGVIGWWVQYRPGAPADACDAATKLMAIGLNTAA